MCSSDMPEAEEAKWENASSVWRVWFSAAAEGGQKVTASLLSYVGSSKACSWGDTGFSVRVAVKGLLCCLAPLLSAASWWGSARISAVNEHKHCCPQRGSAGRRSCALKEDWTAQKSFHFKEKTATEEPFIMREHMYIMPWFCNKEVTLSQGNYIAPVSQLLGRQMHPVILTTLLVSLHYTLPLWMQTMDCSAAFLHYRAASTIRLTG